ncbi:tRNA selenocysteine 1-associated protein 1-like isoform X2 [Photinus pyralis]|uniref:tRNA selenocysteine 1-associated protein 1-like isoform X2 n=1 Tax=Photinus pyralis TaxID=7054 RepID=UPI0012673EB4|nr:tRNA selenocysteine 1-associated protein 1-like isoform X2 [Photinus pyralis]
MDCQLWMGGLEPYMNETFISTAFKNTGANPVNVRVMPNKLTGESAGYSFVQFATDKEAIDALHKLNGTPIFGTNPVVRFHLNNANNLVDREFSVWVGDLSSDVDNYNLYKIFSSKYNTVKAAKVILDNGGFSKGYGFVTFGTEQEMKDALVNMDGFVGLGSNTLRVCSTIPKPKRAITTGNRGTDKYTPSTASTDYSYDEAYWQSGYCDHGDESQTLMQDANAHGKRVRETNQR